MTLFRFEMGSFGNWDLFGTVLCAAVPRSARRSGPDP